MSPSAAAVLRWFQWIARAEGVTVLLLFGVAMPMKYAMGDARIMPWVGWTHGVFVVLFVSALASAHRVTGWGWARSLGWLVASMLPGGTFVAERVWGTSG